MVLKAGNTLLNGQYQILRQLGQGGFGFVYLALDRLLGEEVAIKELIPSLVGDEVMLKRFLAEAKATMRLTHERIVRTYNVFSEAGNYYIAMEFMAGGSLETRLEAQSPLPVAAAVRLATEICEGLHYAHQRGVVHCDLKPANVLFTADGSAKVADFGIAHVSEQLLTRTWHTSAGFVAGTLPYMSPEQADGVRDDPRIDVYALGALLYRCLTGRPYLDFDQRETPGAQADNVLRIRTQQATPLSAYNRRVPPWLDEVVLKALAKQPADRYASIEDLRRALLRQKPAAAQPPPPVRPATPAPRRPRPTPKPSRPQRAPLASWFWPLVAGTAVLFLVIVISIAIVVGGNGGGKGASFVTVVVTPQAAYTASPTPELPTSTPLPTPMPPTPTTSPYTYEDDFDDPNSGWDVYDEITTQASYQDGEYRLAVYEQDLVTWGNPDLALDLGDFDVEVDARLVEGPLDNNLGLLVRYQLDSDDFYWFQISSDGYYAVDMLQAGEFVTLIEWEASEAINQGLGSVNRLRVVCNGSRFSFYVNGVHLTDLIDGTFASGSLGLAAGTFDETGVVVHFDNLKVRLLQ